MRTAGYRCFAESQHRLAKKEEKTADRWTALHRDSHSGLFHSMGAFVAPACFAYRFLVVLGIAFVVAFGYPCVAIKQKEERT